jgi:SAM-dependent methyltransferase
VEVLRRGRNARTGAKESQVSLILAERPGGERPPFRWTRAPLLDQARLDHALQRAYASVAIFPERPHPWPTGESHAAALGYPSEALAAVPPAAKESFCGVAHPHPHAAVGPGDVVVDVGCGSGLDALLAARAIGADGRVVGVEPTAELLRKASAAARQARPRHLSFERGTAEDLPLGDGLADVILANGVLNLLVVDKAQALREARRVLKPGGRLVLADVVVAHPIPWEERANLDKWVAGLAGPFSEEEIVRLLEATGFEGVAVAERGDLLTGPGLTAQAQTLGARRVVITARTVTRDGATP